jgi:dCTP diphosphatase
VPWLGFRIWYPVGVTISELQNTLRDFARERDWEQFHTPKNLAMALTGEVGELVELFQWLTPEESGAIMGDPRRAEQVRHELADVFGYVLRLADVLGVDLADALQEKIGVNAQRYPVEDARGHARKYTDLKGDQ